MQFFKNITKKRFSLCWLAFMSTQQTGGSWGGIHGSLNENGPHRLIGSSILSGCDFVGVGVDFLKKMYHWRGVDFEVLSVQTRSSASLFLLPANLHVELLAPYPAPCLPVMLPTVMTMD